MEADIDRFFPAVDSLERVPALYVTETQVELEQNFGEEMLAQLRIEEPYQRNYQQTGRPRHTIDMGPRRGYLQTTRQSTEDSSSSQG